MNVQRLITLASNYAQTVKKAAAALPTGRVTVTLSQAKALQALKPNSIFEGIIKVAEKLGGEEATITLASKASKMHKGVTIAGFSINQGKKAVARGAALINQSAGEAASIGLRANVTGASIHSIFNPNALTCEAAKDVSMAAARKGDNIFGNYRIGKALRADTEINWPEFFSFVKEKSPEETRPLFEAMRDSSTDVIAWLRGLFVKGKVEDLPTSKFEAAIKKFFQAKQPSNLPSGISKEILEKFFHDGDKQLSPDIIARIREAIKKGAIDPRRYCGGVATAIKNPTVPNVETIDSILGF